MTPAPALPDESGRLSALDEYGILNTSSENDYDAIARLAAQICHTPVSIVGFIDATRHWFKASVGLGPLTESPRDISFCGHAIAQRAEFFSVPDTLKDERFADNPLVAQAPHVRFYAGVPLMSTDGYPVGTLCVLDVVPHEIDEDQREGLTQLARQVLVLLKLRRTISRLRIFESAVAHASDAILITSATTATIPTPRIVYANEAVTRTTGHAIEEVLGHSPAMFDDLASARPLIEWLPAIERRERFMTQTISVRKNGETFPVEVSVAPVLNDVGDCTHWVSIGRDLTERRQAEAALLRTKSVEALNERLTAQMEQRRKVEERLAFAALHDDLTGLPNRVLFGRCLEDALIRVRGRGEPDTAVLFLDLDRFKRVNDSFGHLVGDELLTLVAKRIASSLRLSDTLARFGGDEFTVLLTPIKDAADALQMAERLSASLAGPFKVGGREAFIRASIGIAIVEDFYAEAEHVLRDADIAMYRAKDNGRDRCQMFHPGLRERAMHIADLEIDLRLALERKEFRLVYQPIVDLHNANVTGFEALVRWHHPQRGIISPADFIALLEETGLIVPVGERIITEASRQLRIWHDQFPSNPPLTMSINVSTRQLVSESLAAHVERTLEATGLVPEHVHIELTESALMQDVEESVRCLARLRRLGVKLNIDDFGTGYSSLSYLRTLAVDCLKIDRSFISADGNTHMHDGEIVSTIILLATQLRIEMSLSRFSGHVTTLQSAATNRTLRGSYSRG